MNRISYARNVFVSGIVKKAPNSKTFQSFQNFNKEEFGNNGWDFHSNKYSSFGNFAKILKLID